MNSNHEVNHAGSGLLAIDRLQSIATLIEIICRAHELEQKVGIGKATKKPLRRAACEQKRELEWISLTSIL
jgi:hypothetical protein